MSAAILVLLAMAGLAFYLIQKWCLHNSSLSFWYGGDDSSTFGQGLVANGQGSSTPRFHLWNAFVFIFLQARQQRRRWWGWRSCVYWLALKLLQPLLISYSLLALCCVLSFWKPILSFWASDTPVSSFQASDTSSWVPRFWAFWYQFQASEIDFQASELLGPIPLSSKFLNTNSKLPSFWYTNCNLPSFWYTNFKASKPLIPIPSLQGCWYQLSSSQALWYRFSSLQAFWYQFSSTQAFWYLPDVLLIWFLQVRWICVFKE